MIEVTFLCELQLEELAGGRQFVVQLPENTAVFQAIETLCDQSRPELRPGLISDAGRLSGGILVFVNQRPVSSEALRTQVLKNRDSVMLYPAISGG
ncbi:MAG: MoaD/ThiS family protein [Planctomyces sp.]|nr:MoaD/ThiS family protein [Planctomyces sp.]